MTTTPDDIINKFDSIKSLFIDYMLVEHLMVPRVIDIDYVRYFYHTVEGYNSKWCTFTLINNYESMISYTISPNNRIDQTFSYNESDPINLFLDIIKVHTNSIIKT